MYYFIRSTSATFPTVREAIDRHLHTRASWSDSQIAQARVIDEEAITSACHRFIVQTGTMQTSVMVFRVGS